MFKAVDADRVLAGILISQSTSKASLRTASQCCCFRAQRSQRLSRRISSGCVLICASTGHKVLVWRSQKLY
ncbi:TPA: hypothetical protein ACH3X1_010174 [Trebouxia sp. C0004]